MGNGNIKEAKLYFVAGSLIYLAFVAIAATTFYVLGMDAWIGIYTEDEDVV